MRITWDREVTRGFWLAPAIFGCLFMLLGILIFVVPNLLEYIVAGILIAIGVTLLGLAWQTRPRVTYRRIDEE
jgi:energy-coupling factor transporter transmembrane protein EcfT